MRTDGKKKALVLILTITLFLFSLPLAVGAVNDAADLSYSLQIATFDELGTAKNAFKIGDTIHVRISLVYTGTGKAPVYGFQGELHYDPYVMQNTVVREQNGVRAQGNEGQINFVFLDMSGQGKNDAMLQNMGEAVFVAKNNGTVSLYGENFILTNLDASQRYLDDSFTATLIIGTGVKDVTKEALNGDIRVAEKMLLDTTVTDLANPGIYFPGFWVTTSTAGKLETVIDQAKGVLNKPDATKAEIELAVTRLDAAIKLFADAKIFGPRRWSNVATLKGVVQGGNGKIATGFDMQKCRLNTSCTIRMQPDPGYETEYVYVNGVQFPGSDIFTIPSVTRDTTVTVTFCKKPPFTDISHTDWYYISVRFAYHNGLFQGTSETKFSPTLTMSRGMLATVLYRLESQPAVNFSGIFADVAKDLWYTDAVLWANEKGIVQGYGDGKFAPNDFITREQIAVMLYRYAQFTKGLAEKELDPLFYDDAAKVSDYAKEAMGWAVGQKLIQGRTASTINPKERATRAELATILMRYIQLTETK